MSPLPVASKKSRDNWLSVLIPAFEYPEGVTRILDGILESEVSGIECLISDDSKTDLVERAVKQHRLSQKNGVSYVRNKDSRGAVSNWNKLMRDASAEFFLFMHHDEYPKSSDFYDVLNKMLSADVYIDMLFLRCCKTQFGGRRLTRHMPHFLTKFVIERAPSFLLLHNVVGSPSNIVLRTSRRLYFNEALKWSVDVEWMVRLLSQEEFAAKAAPDVEIVSVYNASTSITRSLGNDLNGLRITEFKSLEKTHSDYKVYNILASRKLFWRLLRILERTTWNIFRLLQMPISFLASKRL